MNGLAHIQTWLDWIRPGGKIAFEKDESKYKGGVKVTLSWYSEKLKVNCKQQFLIDPMALGGGSKQDHERLDFQISSRIQAFNKLCKDYE